MARKFQNGDRIKYLREHGRDAKPLGTVMKYDANRYHILLDMYKDKAEAAVKDTSGFGPADWYISARPIDLESSVYSDGLDNWE